MTASLELASLEVERETERNPMTVHTQEVCVPRGTEAFDPDVVFPLHYPLFSCPRQGVFFRHFRGSMRTLKSYVNVAIIGIFPGEGLQLS